MKSHVRLSAFVSAKCAFAIILLTVAAAITPAQTNTFPSSGNVGIGTLSPAAGLDVQIDSATANKLLGRFGNNNTSGGGAVRVYANTTSNGTLYPAYELTDSSFWIASVAADRTTGLRFRTGTNISSGEANLTDRMVVSPGGNVGIGTTTPGAKLDIGAGAAPRGSFSDLLIGSGGNSSQIELYHTNKSVAFQYDGAVFSLYTNGSTWIQALAVDNAGNVGIGTGTPNNKLQVAGNITVDGNIAAKYQDVAEWVPATRALPPGTVVTLNRTQSNLVEASSKAYDIRVAGVISAQPGITLGEKGENKVLVATTGRVRIKVDAMHAPIEIGDLLVTSEKEGVAMKSVPVDIGGVQIHRPGTLIGKALEPLAKGQGEILVLLSLQ